MLARTDQVAVAVTGLAAYRAGFEFTVSMRYREPHPPANIGPADDLHLGIRFNDGRKVANFGRGPETVPVGSEPTGLVLRSTGMGGGLHVRSWGYWLWPLPPFGALTFVCEWPAFGIPETSVNIDGQLILEQAKHSIHLW
jgi:hypothetical protein